MDSKINYEDLEIAREQNFKVTKSNFLIQETRYSLTLLEQKIIIYLISKIEPSDTDLQLYTFDLKRFCDICGIQTDGMYRALRDSTQKLSDKSFWYSASNDEEILLRWISSVRYHKGHGTISIRIGEDMRPFLLDLKEQFTTYHLYNVLSFKSGYSIRMYELLKSCEYKSILKVKVDVLKKMIGAENYVNFKDFRLRVLDTSQREICKYSDINFTYEAVTKGRKVESLFFHISKDFDIIERLKNLPTL